MPSAKQTKALEKIISLASEVLAELRDGELIKATNAKRTRRSGKDLIAFRKMLKSERKKGTSVAELARQHGVSLAYIYQIK